MKYYNNHKIKFSGLFFVGSFFITVMSFMACNSTTEAVAPGNPNAEIIIQSPVGGETFKVGDTLHIKWKTVGKGEAEISSVKVLLSPDSGKTWLSLKSSGSVGTQDPEWGNFPWLITAEKSSLGKTYPLTTGNNLIRIGGYNQDADPNKNVTIARPFTIAL